MNGLADYVSNTFRSSSLYDAQVEHSANTHVYVYTHPRLLLGDGNITPLLVLTAHVCLCVCHRLGILSLSHFSC